MQITSREKLEYAMKNSVGTLMSDNAFYASMFKKKDNKHNDGALYMNIVNGEAIKYTHFVIKPPTRFEDFKLRYLIENAETPANSIFVYYDKSNKTVYFKKIGNGNTLHSFVDEDEPIWCGDTGRGFVHFVTKNGKMYRIYLDGYTKEYEPVEFEAPVLAVSVPNVLCKNKYYVCGEEWEEHPEYTELPYNNLKGIDKVIEPANINDNPVCVSKGKIYMWDGNGYFTETVIPENVSVVSQNSDMTTGYILNNKAFMMLENTIYPCPFSTENRVWIYKFVNPFWGEIQHGFAYYDKPESKIVVWWFNTLSKEWNTFYYQNSFTTSNNEDYIYELGSFGSIFQQRTTIFRLWYGEPRISVVTDRGEDMIPAIKQMLQEE